MDDTSAKDPAKGQEMSFWSHLDVLRSALLKILAVTMLFTIVAFCLKEWLFAVILAPQNPDFFVYGWLDWLSGLFSKNAASSSDFHVRLINTAMAGQFLTHIKASFCAGILCASPYILYQLFRFVSPALYADERKYSLRVVGGGYVMFMLGVTVSYFLIFPLTFRFLGTYQVNADVENLISLKSYISTFFTMLLSMGVVFEIPVLCWLFAKLGFLSAAFMKKYRRHAIVLILIVAAVITPTADAITLTAVSLPMWLLYELSILLVRRTRKISVSL